MEKITIRVTVSAPLEKVWKYFTDPEIVKQWNAASHEWHTPKAANDLRVGGSFSYRMEAKDGSAGFDFEGTYDTVSLHEHIAYTMTDGRKVDVFFEVKGDAVLITETFDPETENSSEIQQAGWLAILENFKKYTETN